MTLNNEITLTMYVIDQIFHRIIHSLQKKERVTRKICLITREEQRRNGVVSLKMKKKRRRRENEEKVFRK